MITHNHNRKPRRRAGWCCRCWCNEYNPKEQWAEERNQNCECQRLKEV